MVRNLNFQKFQFYLHDRYNPLFRELITNTLCSEKTPTHIFCHISEWYVDLNKNCGEYT